MKPQIIRRTPHSNLSQESLHPLLQRVYANRSIKHASELDLSLAHLLPFQSLSEIDKAVCLLQQALREQQAIVIIGDFDADGATSTALAVSALRQMGATRVSYLVPNRFADGYGLTPGIVERAALAKPELIITVDNGIASHAGVLRAHELGIRVLITDHHLPGADLPAADALVNPNAPYDKFPSKNLAGVGVIFYVMLALRAALRADNWFVQHQIPELNMAQFLDLVAFGTVADVVPLDYNNRIFVYQGMCKIRKGQTRFGVQALIEVAKRNQTQLTTADIGFALAPRLNAAGRLDDMSLGIACLLAEDISAARSKAQQLDTLNQQRRHIEQGMQEQASQHLAQLTLTDQLPLGLGLFHPDWHQGVVGLLAARIKERTGRPAIAFARGTEGELKGSGRSIPQINIRDVLANVASCYPQLIMRFGGHAMAAGLAIAEIDLPRFQQAFAEQVALLITEEDLQNTVHSDGELALEELTLEVAELLRNGGPWGQQFPTPVFDNCFFVVRQQVLSGKHLKLELRLAEQAPIITALGFNLVEQYADNYENTWIRAAYQLDVNEFRGQRRVQLLLAMIA